jgi:hypothetical protein
MFNKKAYREYLLKRMERQTPVLETLAGIKLPAPKPIAKTTLKKPRWFYAVLSSFLAFLVLGSLAGGLISHFAKQSTAKIGPIDTWEGWAAKEDETSYSIYNAVAHGQTKIFSENDTSILKNAPELSSDYPYSSVEILDACSLQLVFKENLEPYFDPSFKGEKVDVLLTLLKFYLPKKENSIFNMTQIRVPMIILRYHNLLAGFLSGGEQFLTDGISASSSPWERLEQCTEIEFISDYFFSTTRIVDNYVVGEDCFSISFSSLKADCVCSLAFHSKGTKSVSDVSVVLGSYKKIQQEGEIEPLEEITPSKQTGWAKITALSEKEARIAVTSEELPSLQEIAYCYTFDGQKFYPFNTAKLLHIGQKILFEYYPRYPSYAPKKLFSIALFAKK